MQKTFTSLIAIFFVVAIVHLRGAQSTEDTKNYLVGYLQSLHENTLSEAELRAKQNSELIDLVTGILEKRRATISSEEAKLLEGHIEYFKNLKPAQPSNNQPTTTTPRPNVPATPRATSPTTPRTVPPTAPPTNPSVTDPNQKPNVHHVESEADFNEQLRNAGSKLVVVDFSTDWCKPCKYIIPFLETFTEKYGSKIKILEVDVDQESGLAMGQYKVSEMPTFVFLKDGQEVERFLGADVSEIQAVIDKFTN